MRIFVLAAAVASAFVMVVPASAQTINVEALNQPGAAGVVKTVDFSASIVAIDKSTRTLTLKTVKDEEVNVVADSRVKNFDQLRVGDVVNGKYLEALVLELKKGGGLPVVKTEQGGFASSGPGAKPETLKGRQVTAVGDVIKIDPATQTITVKGPERTVDLHVRDPDQFRLIVVGDQIQATYSEALAVSVTPAPKK